MVDHVLQTNYSMIHSPKYYNHNCCEFIKIKNLLNNSHDSFSFNHNYIKIRNYLYGANVSKESNDLKEIKNLLIPIKDSLLSQVDSIKFDILNWMLMAVASKEELPKAANKFSQ